jgi:hypothetical protein
VFHENATCFHTSLRTDSAVKKKNYKRSPVVFSKVQIFNSKFYVRKRKSETTEKT